MPFAFAFDIGAFETQIKMDYVCHFDSNPFSYEQRMYCERMYLSMEI